MWSEVILAVVAIIILFAIAKQFLFQDQSQKVNSKEVKVPQKKTETKYFTRKEVANHNTQDDCWLIVDNKVYDVTPYVEDHVGGPESISKNAGFDNSTGFHGKQHPEKVTQMIDEYYIGELKE